MFLRIALSRLSPLQKLLLLEARRREAQGLTMTGLAREISRELGIPLSTVKWNLRRLRDLGLIETRPRGRSPYSLSKAGRALVERISQCHLPSSPGRRGKNKDGGL